MSSNENEFMKQQFLALRKEIDDSTVRIFWLMFIGIALVMISGFMGTQYPSSFGNVGLPFFLLAVMISFVNEQNNINRAGKFIREEIEPAFPGATGWEKWLTNNSLFREADRVHFISFTVMFFIFFAISASFTLSELYVTSTAKLIYFWGIVIAYTLSVLCVLAVTVRHWRSSTSL